MHKGIQVAPNAANRCYPAVRVIYRYWPVLLLVAFVTVAWGVLMPKSNRDSITAQLIGQTNTHRLRSCSVLVSNSTSRVQSVRAHAERSTDGLKWTRDYARLSDSGGFLSVGFTLEPGETAHATVDLTDIEGKRRVTIRYVPDKANVGGFLDWRYYRAQIWAIFGRNPVRAQWVYVELK